MSNPTVVLYGATGYTGRLVAAELLARGAGVVLAGRNAAKLRATADQLSGDVSIAVASLDDARALRNAAVQGSVLVNCAGPFAMTGDPVVTAAAAAGAHYLDTTGEQDWIRRLFEVHDPMLRAAGVAAAPGMAFSHAPGDLLAHLVGQQVEPAERLLIAYHVEGFQMTRGTMHSSLEQMNGLDVAYEAGRWIPGGERALHEWFEFPGTIGRQRVARYPVGEIITVPRHVESATVAARISTVSIAPRLVAPLVPRLTPLLGRLLRTRAKGGLERLIARLPEGPAEADRGAVWWTIVVEGVGKDGRTARGTASGPDIYGFTAQSITEAALRMAAPSFSATGAVGAAQAVDPASFLDAMAPFGVEWSTTSEDAPVPYA